MASATKPTNSPITQYDDRQHGGIQVQASDGMEADTPGLEVANKTEVQLEIKVSICPLAVHCLSICRYLTGDYL